MLVYKLLLYIIYSIINLFCSSWISLFVSCNLTIWPCYLTLWPCYFILWPLLSHSLTLAISHCLFPIITLFLSSPFSNSLYNHIIFLTPNTHTHTLIINSTISHILFVFSHTFCLALSLFFSHLPTPLVILFLSNWLALHYFYCR